jgi:outer membrane protein assembly factor BamB
VAGDVVKQRKNNEEQRHGLEMAVAGQHGMVDKLAPAVTIAERLAMPADQCRRLSVVLLLTAMTGFTLPAGAEPYGTRPNLGPNVVATDFVDHGVGAPSMELRGVFAVADDQNRPLVLAWGLSSGHRGGSRSTLLVVDVEAGTTMQMDPPIDLIGSPFYNILSTGGRLYTMYGGTLLGFDVNARGWAVAERTAYGGNIAGSLTQADDGRIFAGIYHNNAPLISFNPRTGELVDHGSIRECDWQQYPVFTASDDAGWVYLGVGWTESAILAYDPATDTKLDLTPDHLRQRGYGRVFRHTDGNVYGHFSPDKTWYRFHEGKAEAIGDEPVVPLKPYVAAAWSSNVVAFPDGRRIDNIDLRDRRLVIGDPQSDQPRTIELEYETEGADLRSIIELPDGRIFGSGHHPTQHFTFTPGSKKLEHWTPFEQGQSVGTFHAVAVQDGRLYAGSYSGGKLYVYDQVIAGTQPKELYEARAVVNVPNVLLAHPDGNHLILGGRPGYGATGGGLLIYDIATNQATLLTHEQVVPGHSTAALVALPDGDLIGGTHMRPGHGGRNVEGEAVLYRFDWEQRQVAARYVPVPGAQEIRDITLAPSGLVFGITPDAILFAFDPQTERTVGQTSLEQYGTPAGSVAPRILHAGADGFVYALFANRIVQIDQETLEHRSIGESPTPINVGFFATDGRLYFFSSSHLWSCAFGAR